MHVGVDQTRQASKFGQVMDNCLIREGWGGTRVVDVDNTRTSDMDRLIQPWLIRQPVDQTATVDDDVSRLRTGGLLRVFGPR